MRVLRVASLAIAFVVATAAFSQSIPYEKYELPNGMTIILHEDHRLPVGALNLWYHVGSKDEARGRSGFAHLFEHLMFKGTVRVGEGEFDTIMETGGGSNNASTSEDRTNYFESGPANLLPTLLWLEADRMEGLADAMTPEKLDTEREVVRNERRQSYENRPYGMSDLRISELMFPEGHPYHIPVIGTHEDLVAATVDDVKNFFRDYYVPANVSLVVAGDFDPEEVKPMIAELFGTLPRGSDPVHRTAPPVRLDGVLRSTLSDRVQFSRVQIVYHSPAYFAPGDAELDLAAAVLSSGISSRLYQRLIYDEPLANDVSAYQDSRMLGSLFTLEATAKPGVDLPRLEAAIDEVIATFVAEGPTQEELDRHRAAWEFSFVSRLQSITQKADMLNRYQFYYGEPDSLARDLQRFRGATVESVRQQAAATLTPGARLILYTVPEIEAPAENPRDARPALGAETGFEPPLPVDYELSNGLKVLHWERRDLPLIEMQLVFPGGAALDSAAEGGRAAATADMLDEGAGDLSAVAFANAMDALGARFGAFSGVETTGVSLSSLTGNFDRALELFASAVRDPRFEEKEWERVRTLRVDDLRADRDNPTRVASVVGMRAFFGDDHPFGRPAGGTPESVAVLTRKQLVEFHARVYRPDRGLLLLAGDLSPDDARRRLEAALGGWKASGKAPRLAAIPERKPRPSRVVVVDKPGAVQTVIRWYLPGHPYADPRRVDYELLNTVLGGTYTSRLNHNLREEHGYTYGAGSRFVMSKEIGYWLAYANVRTDVTGESIAEFRKEFEAIRAGDVKPEEVTKATASYRNDLVQGFGSLSRLLGSFWPLATGGLPFTGLADDYAHTERVTAATLNALAAEALPLDQALLVLVGDADLIREELAGLGLPDPVELTVAGDPK